MAYKREDQLEIGKFLDQSEYLAGMLLSPEDDTEKFDRHLASTAEEFRCPIVYQLWKKV